MQNTENFNFKLPESTDLYDVKDYNENFETVDTKLKELGDNLDECIQKIPEEITPSSIGASEIGHKHTKSEISDFPSTMTPSAHNQAASTITAGTLGGQVVANATSVATLGTKQVRNIYAGTSELTSGTSSLPAGDIYVQYE